jgi:DNA-binding Lrp family transcriptional regulator
LVQPDSLDRRIMRELESPHSFQWNVRESYATIAKKIGVDEETVRNRIARQTRAGLLTGWQLIVNPHLIGRESASVELEVGDPSDKRPAIAKIELIDGVVSILDLHSAGLQAGVYYRHERALEKSVSLMEEICGTRRSLVWKVPFPACDLHMSETDWAILAIIRKDPRKKLSRIASEARVSTRTASRRLGSMVDGFAFFLHASVDFRKLGGLAYRLLVRTDNPANKSKMDQSILSKVETVEWSYTYSDEYSMFVVYCENLAQAEQVSSTVKKVEGVGSVRMDIIEDQITVQDWIDDEIAVRMASSLRK